MPDMPPAGPGELTFYWSNGQSARLMFFDNVYMYGKVDGRMTEETPFNPCSRKPSPGPQSLESRRPPEPKIDVTPHPLVWRIVTRVGDNG